MFRITTNQSILMSRGDDVYFPLFLNRGDIKSPFRYELTTTNVDIKSNRYNLVPVVSNLSTWITAMNSRQLTDGYYLFNYVNNNWLFEDEVTTYTKSTLLSTFGIDYSGTALNGDRIRCFYTLAKDDIVYFYLMLKNSKPSECIYKRVFTTKLPDNYSQGTHYYVGDLCWYSNHKYECIEEISSAPATFDSTVWYDLGTNPTDLWVESGVNTGDMKIQINHDDDLLISGKLFSDLPEGEYIYEIKANLFDKLLNKYVLNSVTNRLPFYIIEDDFSRLWKSN